MEKVDTSGGIDACWIWRGTINSGGYGVFNIGCIVSAHRAAYELFVGHILSDQTREVCHRCDVPLCVNPLHLFLGTHRQNLQDAIDKGRLTYRRMMDVQKFHELLSSGMSQAEMARRLGVSSTAVHKAIKRLRRDGWEPPSLPDASAV